MLRKSRLLIRRGKMPGNVRHDPNKFIPVTHRPFQGGQNYFQQFLLRTADTEVARRERDEAKTISTRFRVTLPQSRDMASEPTTEEQLDREMELLRKTDAFVTRRGFNELNWYEEQKEAMAGQQDSTDSSTSVEPISGADEFENRFGYSLLKSSKFPVTTKYQDLDLWAELPKYTRNMFFLYLINRRRNCYAVMFDYDGKRVHPVYTAGNRGLKGGDKGIKGEGSMETAHQVTSMYLSEIIPILRERKDLDPSKKIDLVVRVLGFYNGRAGGLRAVSDRSDVFNVRYLEDVTPFPINGPKMPKVLRRNWQKNVFR